MNRHERRATAKNRVMAKCNACEADACEVHVLKPRAIYVGDATAPDDLGICKGCPCSAGVCDSCGETEGHWLGCTRVGLPESHTVAVAVH
jgi:hypothetical protein